MLGIFIGTFALMMTLMITSGFEQAISEKVRGINAQGSMYVPGKQLDYLHLRSVLLEEFKGKLAGVSGAVTKQIIVERADVQTVLVLKGIDILHDTTVTNLIDKIKIPVADELVSREDRLVQRLAGPRVLIGHKLARDLMLALDDEFEILIPEPQRKKQIGLSKKKVIVGGVFDIGLEEYDNNFAFCSLDFIHEIFNDDGVDHVLLKFAEPARGWWERLSTRFCNVTYDYEQDILAILRNRFTDVYVTTWYEQYPALVASLKLEKYIMFIIIALITLVASMNMISLLFMYITSKRRDIAILRALGCSAGQIKRIFLRVGMLITATSSLFGLFCAWCVGYLLQSYPLIPLPDVYFVSHLPVALQPELFMIVFVVTMLLGLFALLIPVRGVERIHIVNVLRQD